MSVPGASAHARARSRCRCSKRVRRADRFTSSPASAAEAGMPVPFAVPASLQGAGHGSDALATSPGKGRSRPGAAPVRSAVTQLSWAGVRFNHRSSKNFRSSSGVTFPSLLASTASKMRL